MADTGIPTTAPRTPSNKGRLIGHKPPRKLRDGRGVRTRLQMAGSTREIALLDLVTDSTVRQMVHDVAHRSQVLARATVVRQKTKQPVRFEVAVQTRDVVTAWIAKAELAACDYLFRSRQRDHPARASSSRGSHCSAETCKPTIPTPWAEPRPR